MFESMAILDTSCFGHPLFGVAALLSIALGVVVGRDLFRNVLLKTRGHGREMQQAKVGGLGKH